MSAHLSRGNEHSTHGARAAFRLSGQYFGGGFLFLVRGFSQFSGNVEFRVSPEKRLSPKTFLTMLDVADKVFFDAKVLVLVVIVLMIGERIFLEKLLSTQIAGEKRGSVVFGFYVLNQFGFVVKRLRTVIAEAELVFMDQNLMLQFLERSGEFLQAKVAFHTL